MGGVFLIQLVSVPMALIVFTWFGAAVGSHVTPEVEVSEISAVIAYLFILLIYLLLFKSPLTAIELSNNPNKQWSKTKAFLYLASALIAVLIYGLILFSAINIGSVLIGLVGALGVYCYSIFIRLVWAWLHNKKVNERLRLDR